MEHRNGNIEPYIPVACSFIDDVEIMATRGKEVEIEIHSTSKSTIFKGKIKTWFTRESIEYLQFQGGVYVRMDKIESFNGKKMLDNSCYP